MQLVSICVDFYLPALNSISVTLQFLLQRFHFQPEILKKCQDEIDRVVGQGRLPSLNDRIKWVFNEKKADSYFQNSLTNLQLSLPYTEATLRESMRHETLNPSGLPHSALVDTTFMGYDIPKVHVHYTRTYADHRYNSIACFSHKGSFVFSSLHACHKDERVFEEATEFKPERFLNEDGQFSVKLDKSLPFGAGKRLCAGETFARNAYFLVAAALIQNFNFEMPANEQMPNVSETITGVLRIVPDYWVHVESRWSKLRNWIVDVKLILCVIRLTAYSHQIDLCYFKYSIANTGRNIWNWAQRLNFYGSLE